MLLLQGYCCCCCCIQVALARSVAFCVASDCMLAAAAVLCVYALCAQVLLCMTPLMHPPALPSSCSCCTPLCTCQRLSSQVSLAWASSAAQHEKRGSIRFLVNWLGSK